MDAGGRWQTQRISWKFVEFDFSRMKKAVAIGRHSQVASRFHSLARGGHGRRPALQCGQHSRTGMNEGGSGTVGRSKQHAIPFSLKQSTPTPLPY